jgi:outer membrane immunogenic protein
MKRVSPGLVVALALAAAGVCAPARAADMTPPASSYYPAAPLPPATYDWTGFYVGGNVGGGLLADTATAIGAGTQGAAGGPLTNTTLGPVGVIGGGQAGVNFEWAPWVIGAEVSWDGSNITGSANVLDGDGITQERTQSNPQWFGTVTGRFGWASNDLLFYVKGGGALMHVNYTQDLLTPTVQQTQSIADNRSGFTAGAGIEYAMTENLSARFEYDFLDFGTKDYSGFTLTPISVQSYLHTFTAGVNYRFDWAGGGGLAH